MAPRSSAIVNDSTSSDAAASALTSLTDSSEYANIIYSQPIVPTRNKAALRSVRFADGPPKIQIFHPFPQSEDDSSSDESSTSTSSTSISSTAMDKEQERQIRQCWYSQIEYLGMDIERQETVRAYKAGGRQTLKQNQQCMRGLEVLASAEYLEQKIRQRVGCQTHILVEQQRQTEQGIRNPDSFRTISTLCSRWSRECSRKFAIGDALEACLYFNEIEKNNGAKEYENEPPRKRVRLQV